MATDSRFGASGRTDASGFTIDSKVYIGTGRVGSDYRKDLWEFDLSTNTWSQKADFPGNPRHSAVAFSVGGIGYLGFGKTYEGFYGAGMDLWAYNNITNVWAAKSSEQSAAGKVNTAGFVIGKSYYKVGGYCGNWRSNNIVEYNTITDKWLYKKSFPADRALEDAVGFSIDGKGYIITGGYSTLPGNEVWEYDSNLDTWTRKKDFPGLPRKNAMGFAIGSKGYVGGGFDGRIPSYYGTWDQLNVARTNRFNDFWEYTPSTDSWVRKEDIPGNTYSDVNPDPGNPIKWAKSGSVGLRVLDKGIIVTGETSMEENGIRQGWIYTPSYNYIWSANRETTPSITVRSPGTYTVTSSNNIVSFCTQNASSIVPLCQ
jgi:hypothetical protein